VSTFEHINQRFKEALRGIGVRDSERAVTKILFSVSTQSAALTPRDTSFLINSQFRRVEQTPGGWKGETGYGARYAAAVHEASGKLAGQPRPKNRGTYWAPGGEPKFLEKGIEATIPLLPQILREEYSE
tara:strand:- start:452 stop:838 length:387 start_codon:yes stop_codon:yes gene_type:complete